MTENDRPKRMGEFPVLVLLCLLLAGLFFVSLFIGRYPADPVTVGRILLSLVLPVDPTWPVTVETAVLDVRLPRALGAMLVGAGLSISGTAFQGLFRNPLVSPQILGVSAGAGFGAALALLLFDGTAQVQALAFVFGIIAVGITYAISRLYTINPVLMLVLAGMVVGALFQALTSMIKYVADPLNRLPAIVFWLMGSFNGVSLADLAWVAPPILVACAVLVLLRWRLNLLSLGEEEARSLGVNTRGLMAVIILCTTVIVAAAVSISGMIGWVGLVIPHLGRMIVGPDHTALVPVSVVLGALYLLFVDDLARTLLTTEIPIGIITAIIGAPFFLYLLRRNRTGWN